MLLQYGAQQVQEQDMTLPPNGDPSLKKHKIRANMGLAIHLFCC